MSSLNPIREVRITLTVASYEEAVQFYCDGLGLAVVEQWQTAEGRGMILALGPQTTLELFDAAQATLVDRLEVGRRVSGPVRLAFQVPDVEAEVSALKQAGAKVLSHPTVMPLGRSQCADRNSRWDASDTLSGWDSRRAAERRAVLRRRSTSRNLGRTHTLSSLQETGERCSDWRISTQLPVQLQVIHISVHCLKAWYSGPKGGRY